MFRRCIGCGVLLWYLLEILLIFELVSGRFCGCRQGKSEVVVLVADFGVVCDKHFVGCGGYNHPCNR